MQISPSRIWRCSGLRDNVLQIKQRPNVARCLCLHPQSSKWKTVVGLEIHAQIQCNSKLFSGATTNFQTPVNSGVSFFDAAFPGTLPTLNKRCVEAGVLTALALSSDLNPISHFDRKHYFYADLPAGYQITQQRSPLARNGCINFVVYSEGPRARLYRKSSQIHQIQLEQDSGRSLHDGNRSLVDLNRAGIPLMELVFKPDLCDGEEAACLVKELCLILTRLGTCSCKMEEGALRVDANVSIHQDGHAFGVRTEIKNISSPRAIANAIDYEIKRQIALRDSGLEVVNETLFWDIDSSKTVPMRDKEKQQDYRYMPEPNLPPLHLRLSDKDPQGRNIVDVLPLKRKIPELPEETRQRFQDMYGISLKQALIIVNNKYLYPLFTEVMEHNNMRDGILLSNILINEVSEILNEDNNVSFSASHIGEIVDELQERRISKSIAKKILERIAFKGGKSPREVINEEKWELISSLPEIEILCKSVIAENEGIVKKHMSGKKNLSKTLEKYVWVKSNGLANMDKVKDWFSLNLPFKEISKKK